MTKKAVRTGRNLDPTFYAAAEPPAPQPANYFSEALAKFEAGDRTGLSYGEIELLELLLLNRQQQALPMVDRVKGTTLYRFFNAAGELLYVGISWNVIVRLTQHRQSKPWWTEIASATFQHVGDRQEALRLETEAIATERPKYNGTGPKQGPIRLALSLQAPNGRAEVGDRFLIQHREREAERERLRRKLNGS